MILAAIIIIVVLSTIIFEVCNMMSLIWFVAEVILCTAITVLITIGIYSFIVEVIL